MLVQSHFCEQKKKKKTLTLHTRHFRLGLRHLDHGNLFGFIEFLYLGLWHNAKPIYSSLLPYAYRELWGTAVKALASTGLNSR